ncbi:MAG: thioredoxin domain-containing protein [candidate division NC10 bacterium]|nr:thioredoxin domain-containing protein [candidate division NC10 bacterium]
MAPSPSRSVLVLLILLSLVGSGLPAQAQSTQAAPDRSGHERYTNRLIHSANPYLLLHAHNPVDWYPWGPEALARAKKENKPIFLSIGYTTCYWCHVAERLLYSSPEIAALMNPWFINIKVDREQRPDLDQIYMLATQLMTGHGGWPNNLFLTPDLKPFFGGSYFGPTDSGGRPGFPTILKAVHRIWTTDQKRVSDQADRVFLAMQRVQQEQRSGQTVAVKPGEWLVRARQALSRRFDSIKGGFPGGNGTKFPNEPILGLLLADHRLTRSAESLEMLQNTLDAMAYGGIYDHLAGGFHRYSTDPTWSVPHFEKMLYNNAQLLKIYAQTYQVSRRSLYKAVANGVSRYLTGEMLASDGGFYTAQDAEVNGEEGASYVWTRRQIVSVLGVEPAKRFFEVYELAHMPQPDVGGSSSDERPGVLRVRPSPVGENAQSSSVVERLNAMAPLRAKLLVARTRRPQPLRDEKIIVGMNGLAIDAMVQSGQIFGNERDIASAKRTAERIWAVAYNPKTRRLKHEIFRGHAQTDAYLEDYALLGVGFMSLYDLTKDTVWLTRAGTLADDMLRQFSRKGGKLSTVLNERDLLIVPEDDGDGVYPSGTSAAIELLLRVGEATKKAKYVSAAALAVSHISHQMEQHPSTWGAAVAAVSFHQLGPESQFASILGSTAHLAERGASAERVGLPDTADHVQVTASASVKNDHDEIVTTIHIGEGWHINANPASLNYLIPTTVTFEGLSPTQTIYPEAVRITPTFAPQALSVYEGTTRLVAVFPLGTLQRLQEIRGTVTAQACSYETCLLPAKLPVTVRGIEVPPSTAR